MLRIATLKNRNDCKIILIVYLEKIPLRVTVLWTLWMVLGATYLLRNTVLFLLRVGVWSEMSMFSFYNTILSHMTGYYVLLNMKCINLSVYKTLF